jgi:hypothetical protein
LKIDLTTILIGGVVLVGGYIVFTHVIQPMLRNKVEETVKDPGTQHDIIEKAIANKNPTLTKEQIKQKAKSVTDKLTTAIDSVNESSEADKKLPANSTASLGLSLY